MKKYLIISLLTLVFIGCTKNDKILELLSEIKAQNETLKTQVSNLKRTTDSLSAALKATNSSILNMDKKIDSIQNQLRLVLSQIDAVNKQMGQANANILDLHAKLTELQKKCDELYKLLTTYINSINLVNDGLVAYFPFSGNTKDSSGNGNHGIATGGSLSEDRFGRSNMAYQFSENLSDVISGKLDFDSQSFTVALWVKILGPWNYSTLNLFQVGSSNINNRIGGFALYLDQNDLYGPQIYSIIGHTLSPSIETVRTDSKSYNYLNQWHHIAFVRDARCSKLDLYIDGSLISSTATGTTLRYETSPQKFSIGNYANVNNNPIGKRVLDEVRLYNRALSIDEIGKILKK